MPEDLPVLPGPLDADLLPVLGEDLAVDLVNTRYRRGDVVLDFLATPTHVRAWESAVQGPGRPRWEPLEGTELRHLRDAARRVLDARIDRIRPDPPDLGTVNDLIAEQPQLRSLTLQDDRLVQRCDWPRTSSRTGLAILAHHVVDVAAGPRAASLARCARPGCSMLILAEHHLRRYCTPACAHIDRQNRYLRSRRIRTPAAEAP